MGGSAVRVRLRSRFGDDPPVLDDVHVGLRADGAAVGPGTNRPLTFAGMAVLRPRTQRARRDRT